MYSYGIIEQDSTTFLPYQEARQNKIPMNYLPRATNGITGSAYYTTTPMSAWKSQYINIHKWMKHGVADPNSQDSAMGTINVGEFTGAGTATDPQQLIRFIMHLCDQDGQKPATGESVGFDLYLTYYVLCFEYNTSFTDVNH